MKDIKDLLVESKNTNLKDIKYIINKVKNNKIETFTFSDWKSYDAFLFKDAEKEIDNEEALAYLEEETDNDMIYNACGEYDFDDFGVRYIISCLDKSRK